MFGAISPSPAPYAEIDQYRDVESINYYAEQLALSPQAATSAFHGMSKMSRDHARTVQWDSTSNADFTTGKPWIDINPNYLHTNAEAQYGVENSVFEYYRSLIDLRHRLAVVADGDFTRLDFGHPEIFACESQRALHYSTLGKLKFTIGASRTVKHDRR